MAVGKSERWTSRWWKNSPRADRYQPPTRPFATPVTDEEVEDKRRDNIPKKTKQDTEHCLPLWNQWHSYRQAKTSQYIPQLEEMTKEDLDYWLSRFVLEVYAKKTRKSFLPTRYTTFAVEYSDIFAYMRYATIDFFKDPELTNFRRALDSEMKRDCNLVVSDLITDKLSLFLKRKKTSYGRKIFLVIKPSDATRHHGVHERLTLRSQKWKRTPQTSTQSITNPAVWKTWWVSVPSLHWGHLQESPWRIKG